MFDLNKKIDEYKNSFATKVPEDIREIMINETKKLKISQISKQAIRRGDQAINFILPDINNEIVELKEVIKNKNYIILNFYRGNWCPYCSLELRAYESLKDNFEDNGIEILSISPQTIEQSTLTKQSLHLRYKILSDRDNIVSKKYGLVFQISKKLRKIYNDFNIDIKYANNSDSYEIPMPATYIIDKNMNIIYDFIDEDYTKRVDPAALLKYIKSI